MNQSTMVIFLGVSPKMFATWLWIQTVKELWVIWK